MNLIATASVPMNFTVPPISARGKDAVIFCARMTTMAFGYSKPASPPDSRVRTNVVAERD